MEREGGCEAIKKGDGSKKTGAGDSNALG